MTNTTNTTPVSAAEQPAILARQVAEWTKERDRLQDLIDCAQGNGAAEQPAELTDEQYQEVLRPVLSRRGMECYLNADPITLDPSDYRSIIKRAWDFGHLASQSQAEPVARLQSHISDLPYSEGKEFFDVVILNRARCFDGMKLFATPQGREAQSARVPEGFVLMPRRLTAENGAKSLFMGEFKEQIEVPCPDCHEEDEDYACPACENTGRVVQDIPVGWDTIKRIYAMAVEHLAAAPSAQMGSAQEAKGVEAFGEPTMLWGAEDSENAYGDGPQDFAENYASNCMMDGEEQEVEVLCAYRGHNRTMRIVMPKADDEEGRVSWSWVGAAPVAQAATASQEGETASAQVFSEQIKTTEDARDYVEGFVRSRLKDNTFAYYVRTELAGDFCWNLAHALVAIEALASAQAAPTDLSRRLRSMRGFGPEDFALLEQAADEIERYYGGMMAWKKTAEKKDRDWNAERMGRVNDRIEGRPSAQQIADAILALIGAGVLNYQSGRFDGDDEPFSSAEHERAYLIEEISKTAPSSTLASAEKGGAA